MIFYIGRVITILAYLTFFIFFILSDLKHILIDPIFSLAVLSCWIILSFVQGFVFGYEKGKIADKNVKTGKS